MQELQLETEEEQLKQLGPHKQLEIPSQVYPLGQLAQVFTAEQVAQALLQ